ncbi:MAG: metallophosphoesterase family protein [Actinomycetota bacterium]|nr:metallophosphoesterase family protein [Actinomycetota bacterium]
MIQIGVISDIHIDSKAGLHFEGVDLILSAGDAADERAYEVLSKIAPLKVVLGNMDPFDPALFPRKITLDLGGFKVGLTHGFGSPFGLEGRVMAEFTAVDCIIFGHTHRPVNVMKEGLLLFNPGAFVEMAGRRSSLGLLKIEPKEGGREGSLTASHILI